MKDKVRQRPALLDVNVLIALIDPAHQFSDAAHAWFRHNREFGWATCPLSQNGCLRIMSSPGYPFPGLTVNRVRSILVELTALPGHVFWPDSISILEPERFRLADAGPKQLTDIYLLGLACANNGRLVTFDRSLSGRNVAGFAAQTVECIRE